MPVLKYFVCVGGGLLALLFLADLYIPKQPARARVHYTYHIPITSSAHAKLGPITFSGETRSFGPPPPMTVVDFAARPDRATQASARKATQANDEAATSLSSAEQRAKPERKKVAKRKIQRRRAIADRDVAHLPRGWHREHPTGLAFARPFFW